MQCTAGDYAGMELLVDPYFREQFEIPQPTPQYAAVLRAAPEVFVGTSARLISIVHLLCAEVRRGVEGAGWRGVCGREACGVQRASACGPITRLIGSPSTQRVLPPL